MTAIPYSASTAPFDSQLPVPNPLRLALVADDDHVRRDRDLRCPLFPGPPHRAFRRALSYPPRTHHGRKRRAASRSLAILDETSRASAEPASLAWTHLSGRSSRRVGRRIPAG